MPDARRMRDVADRARAAMLRYDTPHDAAATITLPPRYHDTLIRCFTFTTMIIVQMRSYDDGAQSAAKRSVRRDRRRWHERAPRAAMRGAPESVAPRDKSARSS